MLVPLTMRLIAVPEYGWPRLSAACDRGEPLPAPLTHALTVAGVAVAATLLGSLVNPSRSFDATMLATVVAAIGYITAAVGSVQVAAPRIQASPRLQQYTDRFASAACLPVLASGAVNIIPLGFLGLVAAIAGILMTYLSAHVGARDLLGLEDSPRREAALLVTVVSAAPTIACAAVLSFI